MNTIIKNNTIPNFVAADLFNIPPYQSKDYYNYLIINKLADNITS